MLEEVGERPGGDASVVAFSFLSCGASMRQAKKMTLIKPLDDNQVADESLAVAEQLFEEAGVILGRLLSRTRQDDEDAAKQVKTAVAELSRGWQMAVMERNRVADERKKSAGIVGTYALDFDAARAEIRRRLACLRQAGGD